MFYNLMICESSGNPRAVEDPGGNGGPLGHYGLFQFDYPTWQSVGGHGDPRDASPEEQWTRAYMLYQRRGWRRGSAPPTTTSSTTLERRALGRAAGRAGGVTLDGGRTLLVARTFRERRRGLAKMTPLPAGYALRILKCNSVHTFGMRFALDLVWLGRDGRLLRVDHAVAPRRMKLCVRARSVVETAAGEGDGFAAALDGL